ncbi:hypothetical protein GQ42DRAFT_160821 [Ramicandelaber brevisporus]|nr:hypothetical protein GQ42DRAFT_160821 [Ramicandelaber brevisporus]
MRVNSVFVVAVFAALSVSGVTAAAAKPPKKLFSVCSNGPKGTGAKYHIKNVRPTEGQTMTFTVKFKPKETITSGHVFLGYSVGPTLLETPYTMCEATNQEKGCTLPAGEEATAVVKYTIPEDPDDTIVFKIYGHVNDKDIWCFEGEVPVKKKKKSSK